MSDPTPFEMANAIRALSMDAVQKANSGHPGCPMGMADIAQVLWAEHLRCNPKNPHWRNRDRFILSNGHGSMLLYAVLHLTGYDLSINDLQNFRQLASKTPGHPEYGETPGVETTTGPLGQGLANAVGMALAERQLGAQYNRPGFDIIDHFTYVFLGDGCLMEGISHEACSLAGTLQLQKLIAFYDDNGISIDGEVSGWFTDNTPERFRAYHWHVIENVDGHNPQAIRDAIVAAKQSNKPTLICCKTNIGFGSPNRVNTAAAHGAPLGDDEIVLARKALHWPYAPFEIPAHIKAAWDLSAKGAQLEQEWQRVWQAYQEKHPESAKELQKRWEGGHDADKPLAALLEAAQKESATLATRQSSQKCLEAIWEHAPALFGGSADLSGSNGTLCKSAKVIHPEQPNGNYLHYGVREFAMAGVMNGLSLYGGFIPFGGTFLTFADYQRNAIRLAALMKIRCVFVLTHDSIGLGEDGPTHQPVEHLTMLRATPNCYVWRPCDVAETVASWQAALEQVDAPTVLSLTRQGVPHQKRTSTQLNQIKKGGYVLFEPRDEAQAILIGTGSEVELCVQTAQLAEQRGLMIRVVSMPCIERFKEQSQDYKDTVLPPNVSTRVAVEAGSSVGWYEFVGREGTVVGLDTFGASAPAKTLYQHFGFTVENIYHRVEQLLHEAQPA